MMWDWTTFALCEIEDFVNCWFGATRQCLNPRHI